MANIPSTPTWSPDVTQIETTDAVLGGPDGVINVQAKQLADRTAFLKQEVEAAASVAGSANEKADSALAQIDAIETAAGNAQANAADALAHKQGAQAAQALAEQARNAAQAAQAQAGDNAGFAYQASQTAQMKATEATSAAAAAVAAVAPTIAAKDTAVAARDEAVAAVGSLSDERARAEAAAVSAEQSEQLALGYLNEFKSQWYGPAASDPTVDPQGNPPTAGDAYFNTTLNQVRVFSGTTWAASFAANDSSSFSFQQSGTGAVATTVQEVLRETASVFRFMTPAQIADVKAGTLLVDVTSALQQAVTATAGNAILLFPPGKYLVSASANTMPFPWEGGIKIPSNSYLQFAPGAVIQTAPNNLSKYFLLSLYGVENVVIEGAKVIGDRNTHTYLNVFDTLSDLNSNNYRTKSNYLPDPPVWADGTVAYVYQDTTEKNGTYTRTSGVWVRTSATVPNYFTHEFGVGITVTNSRNIWINRCDVSDFTGDSIGIVETASGPLPSPANKTRNVYVTNCVISTSRRQGISIVRGDNVFITGNSFRNIGIRQNLQDGTAPRSGLDIESGSGLKSDTCIVSGNIFKGCQGGSVLQYDGDNVTITGNVMDSGLSYGFGVNTTITGNTILAGGITSNGARTPIAFTYTQSGTTVTVTTASAHGIKETDSGIYAYFEFLDANGFVVYFGYFQVTYVSSTVLTFNTPGFSSASGNGKYKFTVNNISITGNTLLGNGISINGNGITASNNSVVNSVNYGFYIYGSCVDASISGNIINGGTYGVSGASGAQNVIISDNKILNCTIYGIRVYAANSVVSGNLITRCAAGITALAGYGSIKSNHIDLSGYPITPGIGITTTNSATVKYEISANTVANHSGSAAISVFAPSKLLRNVITGFTGSQGIYISGANSDGSVAIGNVVESDRSTTGTSIGIQCNNNTKFRCIGNTISANNAAWASSINTSASTNSRITNNVYAGAISPNASDTLTGNVAY